MSLFVLAYNIKRMIKILGIKPLLEAIRAHGEVLAAFFTSHMASISRSRLLLVAMTIIPASNPIGAS